MTRTFARTSRRAGVAAAALLAAACADPAEVVMPEDPSGGALFRRYVALGNSLTAGWQSGGLTDSTQRESYAYLMATQSMGTRFAYPAVAAPGCPPPVTNFQTQARGFAGTTPFTSTTCALREATALTALLNNVAVPDARSADPISRTTAASNALTTLFLGGVSQVTKALALDPTFVSVWIGNTAVLVAGIAGVLDPTPGVSPGLTPTAVFTSNFDTIADSLALSESLEGGVGIGVVNVTNTPILFPAAAILNPSFKAGFDLFAGATTTVLPNCTGSTSLISFRLASAIRSGAHPPVISCRKGDFPPSPLVGDLLILEAAEQAVVTQRVQEYNAAIQSKAAELGWAYFDPNPALAQLRASGAIPPVPNLADPINPFGTYISLDGVHPRRSGHVLIANGIIAAINATYSTSLPAVE